MKIDKNIVQHLITWGIILVVESLTLTEEIISGLVTSQVIWLHLVKLVLLAAASYINWLILIPRFLKKKKYILFILFNLISLAVFSFLVFTVSILSYINVDLHDGGWEHHIIIISSIFYVLVFITGSTLISFAQEWRKLKNVESKLALIEKEKMESEHNLLKAQLNPHFLFNTLNNIYSLSLNKSDKTPKVVLKLSSLMSYILYECQEEQVALQKEIDFIRDYIELEKIRNKQIDIDLKLHTNNSNYKVAPLLFIPFVENAFKHSRSNSGKAAIKIDLHVKDQSDLYFYCENSIGDLKTPMEEKYHGIGIENVKKRLQLLYNNQHQLEINGNDNVFTVALKMSL